MTTVTKRKTFDEPFENGSVKKQKTEDVNLAVVAKEEEKEVRLETTPRISSHHPNVMSEC